MRCLFLPAIITLLLCRCENRKEASPGHSSADIIAVSDHAIALINNEIPLKRIIDSLGVSSDKIKLAIDKSDYRLAVVFDTMVLKTYPVVFGGNPIDDKVREGDSCTPEGSFKVRSKYPHNKWSRFIWIDYPNDSSWHKHNIAKQSGLIPRDAAIGGEIGIHGVPSGYDEAIDYQQNWTLGCISMKNKDVEEIYPFVSPGTKIEIKK